MKTAEEILKESYKTTDVFDYPYETNAVLNAIKQAQSEAIDEAVKACAEAAKCIKTGNSGSWMDASIDEKSILKVAEQLKSKL